MLHAGHGVLAWLFIALVGVGAPVVHADGLCDPGWAWFQDLQVSLLEQKAAPLGSRSTGSCLRLFPASTANSSRAAACLRSKRELHALPSMLVAASCPSTPCPVHQPETASCPVSTVLALPVTVVASTQLVLTGGVQQVCPPSPASRPCPRAPVASEAIPPACAPKVSRDVRS